MTSRLLRSRTGSLQGDQLVRSVDLLVDQLTLRGQRIFLRSIGAVTGTQAWDDLIQSIQSGKGIPADLMDEIERLSLPTQELQRHFETAFQRGGRTASKVASNIYDFRPNHQRAVDFMQRFGAQRVVEINNTTRQGIQGIVARGLQDNWTTDELAKRLRSNLGLTFNQAMAVDSFRQRLVGSGVTQERANREAARFAKDTLRRRAETIARTETVFAFEGGKREYWQQAAELGLIAPKSKLVWIIEEDERVDDICEALAGKTVLISESVGGTFGGVEHPPIHPNCRCQLILEDKTDLRAKGFTGSQRLEDLLSEGEFSIHVPTGETPTTGFMVALSGSEERIAMSQIRPNMVDDYRRRHHRQLQDQETLWGGWVNLDDDGVRRAYMDISVNMNNRAEAIVFGREQGQLAIFDLGASEDIVLKIDKPIFFIIPKGWSSTRVVAEFALIIEHLAKEG